MPKRKRQARPRKGPLGSPDADERPPQRWQTHRRDLPFPTVEETDAGPQTNSFVQEPSNPALASQKWPYIDPQLAGDLLTEMEDTDHEVYASEAEDESELEEEDGRRKIQLSDDGYISSEAEVPSDADEELHTLRGDVGEFQDRLRQRGLASNTAEPEPGGKSSAWNKKGVKRGPRKPVEPPLEIRIILAQANGAFVSGEYQKAEELCNQILLMNDETYAAHALLSGIYLEQGEVRLGIIANLSAAHLRPQDPTLWRNCAQLILEHGQERRRDYLPDAIYCFTQLVRINKNDLEARYERALLVRELGLHGRAALELRQMHEMLPHDTSLIRMLAEAYITLQQVDKAIELYKNYIEDHLNVEREYSDTLGWSDVNVYVELFGMQDRYQEGIRELKSLSRWLLGREAETFWENDEEDDREWDSSDHPRRMEVEDFVPDAYERCAYGDGLPLELRIKMGLFRLRMGSNYFAEAFLHFAWLEPENDAEGAKLHDAPDLFREVADSLQDHGLHHEALRYYEPIQAVESYSDLQLYFRMATSYRATNFYDKAEQCYGVLLGMEPMSIDARADLARMYEEIGRAEDAYACANEVIHLTRQSRKRAAQDQEGIEAASGNENEVETFVLPGKPIPFQKDTLVTQTLATRRAAVTIHQQLEDMEQATAAAKVEYGRLQLITKAMREGNEAATEEWLDTARALILNFRAQRIFYPLEKFMQFRGYTKEARRRALRRTCRPGIRSVVGEMEDLADRLEAQAMDDQAQLDAQAFEDDKASRPVDYLSIPFTAWLDLFLECAFELSKLGLSTETYDAISGAADANVFYHDPHTLLRIHFVWLTCAVRLSDAAAITSITRLLMKEHQFHPLVYHLPAITNLLRPFSSLTTPIVHFSSSASQKFTLRQIKSMDYHLLSQSERIPLTGRHRFSERARLSARDVETGAVAVPHCMDVGLLMLYGGMLYVSGSFQSALSYYWRVSAVLAARRTPDPIVDLHIGLSYVHYSMKRQAGNRHELISRGVGYMLQYRDLRAGRAAGVVEMMEAEYNMGRFWHLLGLTHLAVPCYEKVREMGRQRDLERARDGVEAEEGEEHFETEASWNLQNLYFVSGNLEMARRITEANLVL